MKGGETHVGNNNRRTGTENRAKRACGSGLVNYWYMAREEEIFLDLDSRRALRRAISVLLVAIKRRHLPVEAVYLYRTKQRGHYHMIVVLERSLFPEWETKHAWSIWMGNDRLRLAYVLARRNDSRIPLYRGGDYGDLLVTTKPYFREHDALCTCNEKHKEDAVTSQCPAMTALLGDARCADYFARTGERRIKPLKVRVPWGEVKMSELRKWVRAK